jgi:hypothetical protein
MLAAAKAVVVPGKLTETVAGLASTAATRKVGTKSRSCLTGQFAPSGKEWLRPQAPEHVKWPLILPPSKSVLARIGCRRRGCFDNSARHRGSQRVGRPSRFTTRASPGMITTASS